MHLRCPHCHNPIEVVDTNDDWSEVECSSCGSGFNLNINLTLIGQSITFFIFVWFCWKFVWPALLGVMQDREQKIAEGLEAAERADKDIERAQKKATEQLKEAKDQAASIVEQANKRAAQIIDEA